MYFSRVIDPFLETILGVECAIKARKLGESKDEKATDVEKEPVDVQVKKLRNLHMTKMVQVYISTTFGSGAIRFTSWILWVVGKFFT